MLSPASPAGWASSSANRPLRWDPALRARGLALGEFALVELPGDIDQHVLLAPHRLAATAFHQDVANVHVELLRCAVGVEQEAGVDAGVAQLPAPRLPRSG